MSTWKIEEVGNNIKWDCMAIHCKDGRWMEWLRIQVVIWLVTLCSNVVGYQYFRGPCWPCLCNVIVLHPRRP